MNTERAKLDDIMKNEEIRTIIYSIGAGAGTDFSLEDSNYDKVVIMTDADTDGLIFKYCCSRFSIGTCVPSSKQAKCLLLCRRSTKLKKEQERNKS
ncbi:hypothetical protein [Geomicrobium sp. JCM 19039]|uniref:hypothetical protein n=1 Tax=Geomicrobium sp. JCM 19039 TaxID=1460636 RepID=UPI0021006B52|nr:hypothetical protein [Geomicrobium sp. JCM 19039]